MNMEYAKIIQGSSNESALDKITSGTDAFVSQLRTNFAYAETQSAFARILNSIGLDIMPKTFSSNDSASMGVEFEAHWTNLQNEYF